MDKGQNPKTTTSYLNQSYLQSVCQKLAGLQGKGKLTLRKALRKCPPPREGYIIEGHLLLGLLGRLG